MSAKKATQRKSKGFTAEEKAAMKERAKELKAAEGESAVLERIAEMQAPDRAMAKKLHAIVKASAPTIAPRTWYGMPAYAKGGKVVCFFQARRSSSRGMRRSASTTRRISTRAPCGRPPSR
jgi:surface antigen